MNTKTLKKWMAMTGLTISMLMFTACQAGVEDEAAKPGTVEDAESLDRANNEETPDSANMTQDSQPKSGTFYDGADLEGSVVKFTDESCFISPSKAEKAGEGEILEAAAPGSEDLSQLVEIIYDENCQFQIINLDMAKQTEVSREDTVKEEIKKGTEILVFGSSQDDGHWTAEKVAIMRWQ